MLEKGKIGARQFTILVSLYVIGSAILVIPAMLAAEAKQDAWISALLAIGIAILVIPLYVALGNRFPQMTLIEFIEEILGQWLGKAISLLFLLLFPLCIACLTLRNIGDFITTQVITDTPNVAVYVLFLSVVIMGVRLGLETLARTAELFFPWVVLLFLLLIVCIAPQMKLVNIQPILDDGFKPILSAAIPFISFPFLEPVLFLMLSPYINRTKQTGKALFTGISIGGLFLFIITILTVLVIGVEQSIRQNYPSYMLARQINVGHFLERIEILIAVIWIITIFFRMSILLYVLVLGTAQVLNLKDYRFLPLPLCIVIIALSIVFIPGSTYLLEFDRLKVWPYYVATIGLVFPMLLLTVAMIRNKRSQ